MSLILGYDVESTGLDLRQDYILELGAVLYDTKEKQPVQIMSRFLKWPSRPVISPFISKLTGINQDIIEAWGTPPDLALAEFLEMAEKAEFVVGHNVFGFDKEITENNILRLNNDPMKRKFYDLKWIDTQIDLPFPDDITVRKLKYLCFEHGIYLNNAHRALFDVFACLHLLEKYDFEQIKEIASTPILTIEAKVDYQNREKAKLEGFHWEKPKWIKRQRKYFLEKRGRQFEFPIEVLSSSADGSGRPHENLARQGDLFCHNQDSNTQPQKEPLNNALPLCPVTSPVLEETHNTLFP